MKKETIGVAAVIALLVIVWTQSATANTSIIYVYAWADKPQYKAGDKGTLKISILNNQAEPIEINNITIVYPWHSYDAEKGEWVGNETIKFEPPVVLSSNGGNYYEPVEFTIPNDGRAHGIYLFLDSGVEISVGTSEGTITDIPVNLVVSSTTSSMSIADLATWMTYLIIALLVCTIILAIVLVATRGARATRVPAST